MKNANDLSRSLRASLGEIIDYAGLFPPAALNPGAAVAEFFSQSKDTVLNWLFRCFVLPFAPESRCQEIIAGLGQAAAQAGPAGLPSGWGGRVAITALLPGLESATVSDVAAFDEALAHARRSFEQGCHLLNAPVAEEQRHFRLEAVEWALPLDHAGWDDQHQAAVMGALRAMRDLEPQLKIYIEVNWQSWSPAVFDHLKGLAGDKTHIYCKIRTGGLTAGSVPPPAQLARILFDLVTAEIGFKCTAGLHAALYETSPRFGFQMHGFVNLLCAIAGIASGLKEQDVLPMLTMGKADAVFGWLAENLGHGAGAALTGSRKYMHSFGSCSVTEPRDSLNCLLKGMSI